MKKRRTLIISLLLIAAIALGIGYAGQTSRLVVNGSGNIDANPDNFKLEFTAVTDDHTEHDHATFEGATGTFNVSHLDTKGESITFTYTIKNTSPGQIKAYLDQVVTVNTATLTKDSDDTPLTFSDYYTITTTIGAAELEYNGTTTLEVKVECIKTITDNATLTYIFHLDGHSDPASVKTAPTP